MTVIRLHKTQGALRAFVRRVTARAGRAGAPVPRFAHPGYLHSVGIALADGLRYGGASLPGASPVRARVGFKETSLDGVNPPTPRRPDRRPTRHCSGRRLAFIVALTVLTLGAASALQYREAQAAQSFPTATDFAYYVTAGNDSFANMRVLGCDEGSARATDNSNSEVILAFGGQDPNYSQTLLPFHDAYLSYNNIIGDAEWFAIGYYQCTGSDYWTVLKLGIGTSNDDALGEYDNLTNATNAGTAWTQVAQVVYNYVASQHMNGQVSVWAASDMETEWGSQTATNDWSNGFAAGSLGYVDYGDAGGCSWTGYTGGSGYGCNGGWNQYGVWYASWGAPPAYPLPEIYHPVNAEQWFYISEYGYHIQGGARLAFDGPMDEYDRDPSTDNNIQAWDDLSNQLEGDPNTNVPMTYSVEIH